MCYHLSDILYITTLLLSAIRFSTTPVNILLVDVKFVAADFKLQLHKIGPKLCDVPGPQKLGFYNF